VVEWWLEWERKASEFRVPTALSLLQKLPDRKIGERERKFLQQETEL